MKLVLKLFPFLIIILFYGSGCDPELTKNNTGTWYIHNNTDQMIVVSRPGVNYFTISIAPNEVGMLQSFDFPYKKKELPYFSSLFEYWDENPITIVILSEDGELLHTWLLSEKDSKGKQFFNESSWEKSEEMVDVYTNIKWTFTIEPEDIN